ncbi:LEM domain-containing protein 1 [Phyllostomus discolor]|uniref:LEM domain-containing protein 1 n=1 Tax=Phyllostomus discolor TaxID=89673 RepID=A0A7E6CY08_9CHIR|nr:LEM domain-containing protein 1 [Phyllostomus discolor]
MVDVKCLSDDELQHELDKLGFSPGPVLSSTRKLYENKLIQLLVSPPCASPPVKNEPGEQDGAQGCDDNKEDAFLHVHRITLQTRKVMSIQPNIQTLSDLTNCPDNVSAFGPMISPTSPGRAAPLSPEATQFQGVLRSTHSCFHRGASRAPDSRPKGRSDAEEKDCRAINCSVGGRDLEKFPVGVKLAAFVIFVIVIFVYITVEKKPLLG